MKRVTPCLWFNNQAEEAANFYISIFKDSRILNMTHYGESGPGPEGQVLTVTFELDGAPFMGLDGGPAFQFSEAVSFVVDCDTQEEIDYYWEKLSQGGEKVQCGWLKDKFGVSWQVVPRELDTLITQSTPERRENVMKAMLQMTKLDIAKLREAAGGDAA